MGISRIGIVKIAALAACALAGVSCGSSNTGTPQSAATASTAASATVTALPPLTRTSSAPAPLAQTETETVTVPAEPAQVVPCVDPNSDNVRAAVERLGTDSQGGSFVIDDHSPGTSADGCPQLEWARATGTGIRNGTVQSHILFFTNAGRYLGTATSEAYSYTSVLGYGESTVDVRYRWLNENDAFCCPSNESVVTFHLNGDTITPSGQFPPKP